MQTGSEQLKAQQRVMTAKGFYSGKIDGIWGPASIAAKQKWERSGKFTPAIPNNGFPLDSRGALPSGVRYSADGSITCTEVSNTPPSVAPASNQQAVNMHGGKSQSKGGHVRIPDPVLIPEVAVEAPAEPAA